MPFLMYVVLMCLCVVEVAAEWSPVWNDTLTGWFNYAAFDPLFPDLTVVYTQGYPFGYTINVTTGNVLWSINDTHMVFAAVRGGVLFCLTSVPIDVIHLYAFDAFTGNFKWTGPQFDGDPTIVAPQGTELLIVLTNVAVYAVNGSSGNMVWSFQDVDYPQYFGVMDGVVSVASADSLYGVDLNSGASLWQVNVSGYITLTTPSKGIVTYQRGTMFYVDAIDVFTGKVKQWAALNTTNTTAGNVFYDAPNKAVVVLMNTSSFYSSLAFDSTSGVQVAMINDIFSLYPEDWYECVAGLFIYYTKSEPILNLVAVNYLTGSLAWNVAVPKNIPSFLSFTYMRPNLILGMGFSVYGAPAVVFGIDPTSGKFWTQDIGNEFAYVLQQRGSSQVLVGSIGTFVLANV